VGFLVAPSAASLEDLEISWEKGGVGGHKSKASGKETALGKEGVLCVKVKARFPYEVAGMRP
jgi:hypothetical protein